MASPDRPFVPLQQGTRIWLGRDRQPGEVLDSSVTYPTGATTRTTRYTLRLDDGRVITGVPAVDVEPQPGLPAPVVVTMRDITDAATRRAARRAQWHGTAYISAVAAFIAAVLLGVAVNHRQSFAAWGLAILIPTAILGVVYALHRADLEQGGQR